MYCPNCGMNNADGVTFCANCGSQLENQQAPQQPEYQAPYQPYPSQPAYNAAPAPKASVPGKGLGIASLILGIISIVTLCLAYTSVPLICGILSFIFSLVGKSQSKKAGASNGCAVAGLILSIICIAIHLLALFLVIIGATFIEDIFEEFMRIDAVNSIIGKLF